MTSVIIEDEKPSARLLEKKISLLGITNHCILSSIEESVEWFQKNGHPDVIFLDIQLSDGISFEIFEKVEVRSFIIFTTAYNEYALKAFKLKSIDYLLKPIDDGELKNSLQKLHSWKNNPTYPHLYMEDIKKMLFPSQKNFKERFVVKIGMQMYIIPIGEVECFFSAHKGTFIHTKNNKNYDVDESLDILENLIDAKKFFRVNRQCIIALNSIKEIILYSNSRLKIILPTYKEEIIVSREKVSLFKEWMD